MEIAVTIGITILVLFLAALAGYLLGVSKRTAASEKVFSEFEYRVKDLEANITDQLAERFKIERERMEQRLESIKARASKGQLTNEDLSNIEQGLEDLNRR